MRTLELMRWQSGERALVGLSREATTTLLFFHGAGLEPTAAIYEQFARELPDTIEVVLPFLSATHFLSFEKGFRSPSGWACHSTPAVYADASAWISRVATRTTHLIVGGHSWGGYLAAATSPVGDDLFLMSPITSLRSLVETNFGELPGTIFSDNAADWIRTRADAPFPFLQRETVVELADSDTHISKLVGARTGRTLIVYGAKEHHLIHSWTESVSRPYEVKRIEGAGHFYNGQLKSVANALFSFARK